MNMTDVFHMEIIRYVDKYGYVLMYQERQIGLCKHLNVTPKKLEKLLDLALAKKYLALDSDNHPYRVNATADGLAFASSAKERQVQT